jgi:hypothetical protein
MVNINENKELHSFVQRSINSFTAWDILLHYAHQPKAQETPKSISKLLGKSHDEIANCLEHLAEIKILKRVKKNDEYFYLPSAEVKNSQILKMIKQCLDDKDKRVKLLSVAMSAIREQKSGKRRKTS